MKIWEYSELAKQMPNLWKILERREEAHRRREAKKPLKKRKLCDPEAARARDEIQDLLNDVEINNKCECCRAIEVLEERIAALEGNHS